MERSSYYKLIFIAGALAVSQGAFSRKTKEKIWERDKGKSVWSGETEDLTVAHVNHDKTSPDYDKPNNGRLLTKREQYIDHFNRHGTTDIGIPENKNKSALGVIYHSLDEEKREGLPPISEVGKKYIPLPKKK